MTFQFKFDVKSRLVPYVVLKLFTNLWVLGLPGSILLGASELFQGVWKVLTIQLHPAVPTSFLKTWHLQVVMFCSLLEVLSTTTMTKVHLHHPPMM